MNYQDGFEFEKRCAAFLKTKGYHKITVTPPSGDQGIDIIAYKSGLKYGIQCKYYSAPVGNKAVQEAYSGARFYDCNRAAVMTNHTFTKAVGLLQPNCSNRFFPESILCVPASFSARRYFCRYFHVDF